jgi:nitroreductase
MQELLKLIQGRRSVRSPYDPGRPVSVSDLKEILEAGRWAPTAHNMQNFEVIVDDDTSLLQKIGGLERTVSEIFIRENFQQLSFSEEELRTRKKGLLGTMFPEFMRTPGAKPDPAALEQMSAFQSRLVQTTRVLLVVLYDPSQRAPASVGDFLGIISLGCVMQNMWLAATSLNISLHILSAFSAGPVQEEVKTLLGVPRHLRIAFTARLGYPVSKAEGSVRVRREVQDFTHHNRFGQQFV